MRYNENFDKFTEALEGNGAFLVAENDKGRVNVMTIGWAQLGFIWGGPVLTVLVRSSRYTHAVLEKAAHFSVCVPRRGELKKELAFCGTKSGRDYDKVRVCGMKLKEGAAERLKFLDGCELVYQCELIGRTALDTAALPAETREKYYPAGETPHTLYFGKVIKAEKF